MAWPDEVQYAKDTNGRPSGLVANNETVGVQTTHSISSVPSVLVGLNGTTDAVAASGILTHQALNFTYANGWVRLPAGMVSGRGAGFHYFTGISTTTMQLKDLFVADNDLFVPYVPTGTLTNAVGTTSVVAQTTGSQVCMTRKIVKGGSIGKNGIFNAKVMSMSNAAATNKSIFVKLGTNSISVLTHNSAGTAVYTIDRTIRNRGSESVQIMGPYNSSDYFKGTIGDILIQAVNTGVDQYFDINAQIATTTDFVVIEGHETRLNFMG